MHRRVWFALLTSVALVPVSAQEIERLWSVDDILLAESAGGFALSPDGAWAVYVKTVMDKEEGKRISNLVLRSLSDDTEIELTRGKHTHGNVQWSPDGRLIGFMSNRDLPKDKAGDDVAKTQLWLMNARGGEPWPLTNTKREVKAYDWRDKDTIVFLAQEDPALLEQKTIKDKDTTRAVEDADREPPVRMFSIDVDAGKIARVTQNDDWMESVHVSPDGRWAVTRNVVSLSYEFDDKRQPETFLTDLDSGESRELFDGERLPLADVAWQTDSKAFYFTTRYSDDPRYLTAAIHRAYYFVLEESTPHLVDLDWERSLGPSAIFAVPGGFAALLADGVYYRPARFAFQGDSWERSMVSGEHVPNITEWTIAENGESVVYNHSTASTPTTWHAARLHGSALSGNREIVKRAKKYEDKPIPKTQIVHWTGARGDVIEGIVTYPLGYEEGKRYPTTLLIHGGPAGMDMDAWGQGWGSPKVLLAQEGIAILQVNYHGSANYGLEWLQSIGGGDYYALPRADLESGVDYLIERGIADPERLGTMGWSNGSILSIDLVVHNPRYKAISAGAGDVEWISDWGNVDFGASFDNYYFGGSPWENLQWYLDNSPFFKLDKVTAPTIIYFGTEDRNVPPSQGWSHFRALQQFGKTDVRFLLFPGEPHGLGKYQHQKRKVEEEIRWFKMHLLGEEVSDPVIKDGSRLDVALSRSEFAKDGKAYGRLHEGKLVPEVVKYEDLQIGRFEVTRAQFKAFDLNYVVPEGTENFPASGITFEQAKAYVEWLAQLTGDAYRLGTEKEMKHVYAAAKGEENTLDYWAGYAPNPEDAAALLEKAAAIAGDTPLLMEVGRMSPLNEDTLIFDLGGNVAEWVTGENGDGVLLGGSADRAKDAKSAGEEVAASYQGFRVVVFNEPITSTL